MLKYGWLVFFLFVATLLLESIGTFVSVVGFAKTFNNNYVIIMLAIVLDFCKLVIVSALYQVWSRMGIFLSGFLLSCALASMLVTSYGLAGYLADSFQKDIQLNTTISITLNDHERERSKLENRKKEMDLQIAQMPSNYITSRQRLLKSFEPELVPLNKRLLELDKLILSLKTDKIKAKADLGPAAQFSDLFNVTIEQAIAIIIIIVVLLVDPLAIALLVLANMLVKDKKLDIEDKSKDKFHKEIPIISEPNPIIDTLDKLMTIDETDTSNKKSALDDAIDLPYDEVTEEDRGWSASKHVESYAKSIIKNGSKSS